MRDGGSNRWLWRSGGEAFCSRMTTALNGRFKNYHHWQVGVPDGVSQVASMYLGGDFKWQAEKNATKELPFICSKPVGAGTTMMALNGNAVDEEGAEC